MSIKCQWNCSDIRSVVPAYHHNRSTNLSKIATRNCHHVLLAGHHDASRSISGKACHACYCRVQNNACRLHKGRPLPDRSARPGGDDGILPNWSVALRAHLDRPVHKTFGDLLLCGHTFSMSTATHLQCISCRCRLGLQFARPRDGPPRSTV